jgi:FeS assembly SUF system protein
MITEEQVYDALKEVHDPEIPVNIVDLGLIYGVKIDPEGEVHVTMTLTTPGCGMAQQIALNAKQKVKEMPGVKEAKVTVVWEPPWDPSKMSEEAKKKLGTPQ